MTTFGQLLGALRNIPVRRLISALERDGFVWMSGKGAHRVYRHPDGREVLIAYHKGSATLPRKTLHDFLENTRWNREDAIRLKLLKRRS